MANSGGGHIILGVADDGIPDGMPEMVNNTSIKDWLEQKIPNLVIHPLNNFRVHIVERRSPSRIPPGKNVVVIDVEDSGLAPHQCAHGGGDATKYMYYCRQAGTSAPAPHFVLELLRQRLVSPELVYEIEDIRPITAKNEGNDRIYVVLEVQFKIRNGGRITAYKWQLRLTNLSGISKENMGSYDFGFYNLPDGIRPSRGYKPDISILPGGIEIEKEYLGVHIKLPSTSEGGIYLGLRQYLDDIKIAAKLATEMSPGEEIVHAIKPSIDYIQIRNYLKSQTGI
jgi:hypothetical protein